MDDFVVSTTSLKGKTAMCDYTPKEVWIIFDPMDGPHIFSSEKEARQTYKEWKDSVEDCLDSFWDMTKPTRYVLYVD